MSESKLNQDIINQLRNEVTTIKERLRETDFENNKREKLLTIGKLSSRISHDLRDPLMVLQLSLEMLTNRKNYPGLSIDYELKRMLVSVDRLSHQVNSVLNFLKVGQINFKNHSLKGLVEKAICGIKIPKNISLINQVVDSQIKFDGTLFEVLISNIIINAMQAIGESKGWIKITTTISEGIIIHIANSGPPIKENPTTRIFEPLYTTKQQGTGLGLMACKNIVDLHKGSISVSNYPTTFSITLPNLESLVDS